MRYYKKNIIAIVSYILQNTVQRIPVNGENIIEKKSDFINIEELHDGVNRTLSRSFSIIVSMTLYRIQIIRILTDNILSSTRF